MSLTKRILYFFCKKVRKNHTGFITNKKTITISTNTFSVPKRKVHQKFEKKHMNYGNIGKYTQYNISAIICIAQIAL